MKVKELIEELKKLDPELTVTISDSEYGTEVVTEVRVSDIYAGGYSKATAVDFIGDYPKKEYFDPKYYSEETPPAYKPMVNPIIDSLKEVFSQAVRDQIIFIDPSILPKPNKEGFVEFPIHRRRKNDKSS